MERLTHLSEDIALGNAAGISLVDGRAQRFQLGLKDALLALQSPQRGTHHLAGVLKTPGLHRASTKAVEFLSQISHCESA